MRNFIISLLMCLMIWTVIGKGYEGYVNIDAYLILENEQGTRKVIESNNDFKNPIIVGDKIRIWENNIGIKTLQRIK